MLDYEMLRLIWWLLIGIMLAAFAISDGFDFGIAALLPFLAKNDNERRVLINTIGPVWESNQVWLILGAGALFAAWPMVYAVAFSGFYLAMLLLLFALIIRPVGFKYRSKFQTKAWRYSWDMALCLAAIIASLTIGIAIGNVIEGVPFYFTEDLHIIYSGTLLQLFNPFALLCGLLVLSLFVMQGCSYLANKVTSPLAERARNYLRYAAVLTLLCYNYASLQIPKISGYRFLSPQHLDGPSNPLLKTVVQAKGLWLDNYQHFPVLFLIPIGLASCCLLLSLFNHRFPARLLFSLSSLTTICAVATLGAGLFPFILPSSSHPSLSLTLWDASSSQLTLFVMLLATLFFIPLIIFYTQWVYHVLRGPIKEQDIHNNEHSMY